MNYVYVLRSLTEGKFYVGYTNDLRRRFAQHEKGQVPSTRNRLPVELLRGLPVTTRCYEAGKIGTEN